jgi:hypothetical protein
MGSLFGGGGRGGTSTLKKASKMSVETSEGGKEMSRNRVGQGILPWLYIVTSRCWLLYVVESGVCDVYGRRRRAWRSFDPEEGIENVRRNVGRRQKKESKRWCWLLYVVESGVSDVYWNTLYSVPPYSLVATVESGTPCIMCLRIKDGGRFNIIPLLTGFESGY